MSKRAETTTTANAANALVDKYSDSLRERQVALGQTRRVATGYILLKFLLFAASIFAIYLFFASQLHILFAAMAFVGYLVVVCIDAARARGEREIRAYIALYEAEIGYLRGDLSLFDGGNRYISQGHSYSFDLDIFGENSLYAAINRTISPSGADLLAEWLQTPLLTPSSIVDRQDAIGEISQSIEWSHKFRCLAKIYPVGAHDKEFIEGWKGANYTIFTKLRPLLYLLNGAVLALLLGALFCGLSYGYLVVLLIFQILLWIILMQYVGKAHRDIDKFLSAISNYFYLIEHLRSAQFESKELREIVALLHGEGGATEAFQKLRRLQRNLDSRNNDMGNFILNMSYFNDAHIMLSIAQWHSRYVERVESWIEAVDKVDALVSMANYRYNHPDYCLPQPSSETIITAQEMAHPLIGDHNAVANDIEVAKLHDIFIVTGANMSGKSTFLRGVGLNMVLALTGSVARSRSFHFRPIQLFTSMRTSDNLSKGESYFHAELLRLKMLHDSAAGGTELFVILDEMLKGTNSKDKLNGSWRFLIKLLSLNLSGLVATHDLKLGELKEEYPSNFHNICFEIEQVGEELIYSYKLQVGVSRNMNASLLLSQMNLI